MNEKICGYYLDKEQKKIVLDNSNYLLVTAGAGSGKTLTILGKINYLVKYKKMNTNDILCISFTKSSSDNLKNKIKEEFNLNVDVYTFHKLALNILNKNRIKYSITSTDTLDNIIYEFMYIDVLNNKKMMKRILNHFNIKYKNKKDYLKYINNNKEIIILMRLISTFIRLFKCNNYTLKDFIKFKKRMNIFNYKKEKNFLIIVFNIYLKYQKYLEDNKEIDFDDMIIKATNLIDKTNLKYKYIIIQRK